MTLKELIESNLIKDDEIICIRKPLFGTVKDIRRGNWYQDQILDLMDEKIDKMTYCCSNWNIDLQFNEEDL